MSGKGILLSTILSLLSAAAVAQPLSTPTGSWDGVFERQGATIAVRVDLKTEAAGKLTGSFTSETQRVLEYPLEKLAYSPPKIHWELGDSAPMVFDGFVSANSMTGTFRDGKDSGTFSFRRTTVAPPPYRREDITVRNGDVALAGTLLRPRTPGSHPGIVFLHGSGPESRWGTSFFLADRFARAGIAALVIDKRGVGQSTGDWKTIDNEQLADDYVEAVRFLQRQPGVNPKGVGIYGHSQGGTISPLIASRPGAVAFVIAAAAIGTGPLYEQDIYRTRNYLLDEGLTDPDLSRAMEFYTLWINTVRTGKGIDEYEEALAKVRHEKWLATLGIPPRDHWLWTWYPPVGNLNPLPYWEKVRVPVLLIYGELDRNTPVGPSLAGIGRALRAAGNPDFTPIIIPGAVHNLTIQPEKGQAFFWWYAAPGYKDLLIAWVRARFQAAAAPR
jgi:pimeloyl-ACP methyl ester carboxylesterase